MVEIELAKELGKFIAAAVKDYRLPVRNGDLRAPQVVIGYLPPKRSKGMDDFPFVIVRPVKGQSEERTSSATVDLIIGCYCEEDEGFEHCLNVMSSIRTALCRAGTIANKYQFRQPITWELAPEQPFPQWLLSMTTEWVFAAPIVEHFEEDDYFDMEV